MEMLSHYGNDNSSRRRAFTHVVEDVAALQLHTDEPKLREPLAEGHVLCWPVVKERRVSIDRLMRQHCSSRPPISATRR